MVIEGIVADEVSLWTEGIISWISNNRGSPQGKRVQFVDSDFCLCVVVLLGEVS